MTNDSEQMTVDHRVVCAWCRKELHQGAEPVSHGICPDCATLMATRKEPKKPMNVTYTLSVTVSRAITILNDDDTLQDAVDWMCGPEAKRELEREILAALRHRTGAGRRLFDGNSDAEVLDAVVVLEPTP